MPPVACAAVFAKPAERTTLRSSLCSLPATTWRASRRPAAARRGRFRCSSGPRLCSRSSGRLQECSRRERPDLQVKKPAETRTGRQPRSEEHTSELQSHLNLVCRLLLEKKKNQVQDRKNYSGFPCTLLRRSKDEQLFVRHLLRRSIISYRMNYETAMIEDINLIELLIVS